ncbi:MAG: arsenate reductase ArsC [Gammaproteobacteria bacterium]|jgi:arsenate reductase
MAVKPNLLFLCTGNSCRSQMAEGWGKQLQSDRFNIYSAGIEKHGLNPKAVKVMAEQGVDISSHYSKTLDDLKDIPFDIVITVCGHADETCPVFPGDVKKIHHGFDDPPKLAVTAVSEEEALSHYRRVCLEIKSFVENLDAYLTPVLA